MVLLILLGLSTVIVPLGGFLILGLGAHHWGFGFLAPGLFLWLRVSVVGIPIAVYLGSIRNRWMLKYSSVEETALLAGAGLNFLVGLFGLVLWWELL